MNTRLAARTIALELATAWRWPSADALAIVPVTDPIDTARFIAALAAELGALLEFPVTAVTADATGDVTHTMFLRTDGLAVALDIPEMLAGAVLGHRCGGAFVPVRASGSAVARVVTEIETAILGVANRNWPGTGEWLAAPIDVMPTSFAVRLEVEGHAFIVPLAIRLPVLATVKTGREVDRTAWAGALRTALDTIPFAVRAVVHDSMIPLSEALALRVGDIVPIETQRDVSLRLGEYALARGTITPDDGGHHVTIAAVGSACVVPASIKEQP